MSAFLIMTEVTGDVIASAANQASTAVLAWFQNMCFGRKEKLTIMSKRT